MNMKKRAILPNKQSAFVLPPHNNPKVSILMPVYKTPEPYLREAIESMLNQTFTDFEFLILDDCPTDNRKEIVLSYQDTRIKYSQNETNLGISESRNKLIDMAKGEYLAIFDHDDISVAERLEKEVEYLDNHAEVGVVSGSIKTLVSNKVITKPADNLAIKVNLVRGCAVVHTAAMIRKSVLLHHHIRYEENFSPCEDYMLWARLIDKTMFHNLPEVLVYYRDAEGNTSHLQRDKMIDKDRLIRDVIYRNHPYLSTLRVNTIRLFGVITLFKIFYTSNKTTYKLFGIIPLFDIKQQRK